MCWPKYDKDMNFVQLTYGQFSCTIKFHFNLTLFTHASFSNVPSNETQDEIYSKTTYHNIQMEMDDNLCVKQCGS